MYLVTAAGPELILSGCSIRITLNVQILLKWFYSCFLFTGEVEDELLHTYTKVYTFDTLLLSVRLAVLVAVTLTVPIVLFPVSNTAAEAEIRASPYKLTVCTQL